MLVLSFVLNRDCLNCVCLSKSRLSNYGSVEGKENSAYFDAKKMRFLTRLQHNGKSLT